MEIQIPHNFKPRDYQLPFLRAMDSGYKRAVKVWHRRAGKEKTDLNYVVKEAVRRVGVYYYFFPTYSQGKKILWDGIDKDGFKFIEHFPKTIIKHKNSQEMKLELINGSIFQVVGTDNIDSVVGTNPIGCVFSEYSLQNPQAWQFMRPILRENGGWAVFNFTPRGENHAYELLQMAEADPQWFTQVLTIKDTGVLTEQDIEQERKEGMPEEIIQQEYYCSFGAGNLGAYYADLMNNTRDNGRITTIPIEQGLDVYTAWDLGVNDTNAIWFFQIVGKEYRIIDYYENSGEGLSHYLEILKEKGYSYGTHYFPHDLAVREYTSGKSREATLREEYGMTNYKILPKIPVADGINAVRKLLPYCWFDTEKTKEGIKCLREYRKEFNEKTKTFRPHPLHNWASNGADAFRYLATAIPRGGNDDIAELLEDYY